MTTKPTTARAGEVSGSGTPRREPLAGGREETIPLVEEQLRISKRDTAHGRVRVRSYVVETPVQEQVTLHQEHVQIERRPVDRPVEAGAESMFQERTIEATETAEEAVVVKEARTREEVVIRKTADDETRTINDTVRRTEVEVDDDRQKTDPAAKPGSNAARPKRLTTPWVAEPNAKGEADGNPLGQALVADCYRYSVSDTGDGWSRDQRRAVKRPST